MQIEQISPPGIEDRILRLKNRVVLQPHELCIERATLFTESYKSTKGEAPNIRFAKAMRHLFTNMTIKIWDDEFIVGNRCTKFVGTPLYPEVRVDTIEQDINLYNNRETQRLLLSDDDKQIIIEEIIPYWKNEEETTKSRFNSYLSPELTDLMLNLLYIVDTNITNGTGHFFPGHYNVLRVGFNGLIQKAKEKMKEFSKDQKKINFLESVIIVLDGSKEFIQRFSMLATELAEKEGNSNRKKEFNEIAEICSNISGNPPSSFKEAFQLMYFTHVIAGLEDGGFAISIGRIDQVLYPFYLEDKKKGTITDEEVQFLIECFYLKLTTLWNYVLHKGIIAAEGPPLTANMTIGGVDEDGNDATNQLSYLFLDSYKKLKTVQPTFSVRIHNKSPDDLLVKTGEAIKSGASIALFNDVVMIPGLNSLGYTLEDARGYAPIGCVEPTHTYKSFGCTNATQLNIVKCLELTLNNGTDLFTRKPYGIENTKKLSSYQDLLDELSNQLSFFTKNLVETMSFLEKAIAELNPQPFLSATIDDCIERGCDITSGGAKYDFTTTQLIGLSTVADSLAVIKKMVYEEKLFSIEELTKILSKNYRGSYNGKKGEEIRQIFINKVPKFGNDNDYVDIIARDVADLFCKEILKYKNYRGGNYHPGIYSTAFHLAFGVFTAASADGRKAREPLSNGVGPTNGMDKNGPTAILNSIKKLDNELITNGNSVILAFHPNTLKIELFLPLIRTYFEENGGYHIQFNVVGKETLCDAQINPKEYQGLVVRIAGYSVLFTELSKSAQDEIIGRTEF